MPIRTLKILFTRDLNRLRKEIEFYNNEDNLWRVEKNIANSGGNLCLHLIGNLNAYIGVGLAGSDYVRKRDLEFTQTGIPRTELIKKIEETMLVVEKGLDNLTPEKLTTEFPIIIWEKPAETGYTLIQLSTHLNYHLGQINYHRRLLDN